MNRHNPAKTRLERSADSVPVTMSGDAVLTRSLPRSSSVTAWVWSRAVADYVQLSQNGHCLAMLIWDLQSAELTTAYTRERLVAARAPGDELTGSDAALDRIVPGWAGAAAGRRRDPAGMGRPGPAGRLATTATAHAELIPPWCHNSHHAPRPPLPQRRRHDLGSRPARPAPSSPATSALCDLSQYLIARHTPRCACLRRIRPEGPAHRVRHRRRPRLHRRGRRTHRPVQETAERRLDASRAAFNTRPSAPASGAAIAFPTGARRRNARLWTGEPGLA